MSNDKEQKIQFLRKFSLFKNLSDYEMLPLTDLMNTKTYEKDTFIFMKNERLTHVYFILEGEIKIFRTNPDGKEQIINILKAPDMFPHQGLFRQGNYPANAQVSKEAKLMSISIADFEEFLIVYPSVSVKMFRILGEIIVDLQNRLEERMLLSVYEQIIKLFIRLADNYGKQVNEDEKIISLQFTTQDLASMIGSSRETVSRTISLLRKENLLRTDENGYYIVQYDALKSQLSIP
ncbi:MAG TPA: Crp/Fnr family transcriptional regulator [Bacillota bacterium]|nr:Crp/Fnr family transcriptional regulator [Bacillota bacterium]